MDPQLISQILYVAELRAERNANAIKIRDLEQQAQAARDKSDDLSQELTEAEVKLGRLHRSQPIAQLNQQH
tara:strand:+ start:385 stop:597 length:213 start_codon:yes stop_codon:yes gene_type:complete